MVKLRHCQLSPQAELVLQQHAAHEQNLSALNKEILWQDAVYYTIFMLPYTQALELALTFISCVYERDLMQGQRSLLQQVRHWRVDGGDPLRHELFEQAQIVGFDNPISCLALSVFWSEGSMTPPGFGSGLSTTVAVTGGISRYVVPDIAPLWRTTRTTNAVR